MPIQDTFIGNLRNARGITNGLNLPTKKMSPSVRPQQQATQQPATQATFQQSYLIEDNNNPKNDRYVRITYDQASGAPTSIEEFFDDNTKILYNKADDFYKTLERDATDYTIVSAPIDVTGPSKIKELSDENDHYLSHATTFFDSASDGQLLPDAVFNYRNRGLRLFGDRRNFSGPKELDKNSAYTDLYKKTQLERNTREKAGHAREIFGEFFGRA